MKHQTYHLLFMATETKKKNDFNKLQNLAAFWPLNYSCPV